MKTPTKIIYLTFALACFAFSSTARAVDPPPDGGYPNANTAEGDDALRDLTTGFGNTAIGNETLFGNTTGDFNTATGYLALIGNGTGSGNTANGALTLIFNTTGSANTANGSTALYNNSTGRNNTGNGAGALSSNTTGNDNTANGVFALYSNTDGSDNAAIGFHALLNNTTGNRNLALGFRAGSDLTTGDNNIDIGNCGQAGESSTIRIGNQGIHTCTFIGGIAGATVPTGVAVVVNANGRLGTTTSSARFKDAIQPMDKASEAILSLRPVTFRYKHELDPDGIPQFGLVAEQVEKVNPALVARDTDGKVYTVRYEAVNAMLLNEFLKEHRKVQELEANSERQQKQLDALTAGLQKVSARLEEKKSAPQMVQNTKSLCLE